MYNEERKKKFLEYRSASARMKQEAEMLFERLAPREIEWGMDISEQPDPTKVESALGSVLSSKQSAYIRALRTLRPYDDWCTEQGYPASHAIYRVSDVSTDGVIRQMVFGPAHFAKVMDMVFAPIEERTTDILLRAVLWLIYMGVPTEKIPLVENVHLHTTKGVLYFERTSYPLYKDAIRTLEICRTAKAFNEDFFAPQTSSVYTVAHQRVESTMLLRSYATKRNASTSKQIMQSFQVMIRKRFKDAELKYPGEPALELSLERVAMSGSFYRMFEREVSGEEIDFVAEAEKLLISRGHEPSDLKNFRTLLRITAGDIQADYKAWKHVLIARISS